MENRIVEINGVKMELGQREYKVIESYKIGDPVKVLIKDYSEYKSYPGVIIAFDDFKALPTIVIAYLKQEYSSAKVEFAYFNEANKEKCEICPTNRLDRFMDKAHALQMLDQEIRAQEAKAEELKEKRKFFVNQFQCYFGDIKV